MDTQGARGEKTTPSRTEPPEAGWGPAARGGEEGTSPGLDTRRKRGAGQDSLAPSPPRVGETSLRELGVRNAEPTTRKHTALALEALEEERTGEGGNYRC